MKDLRDLNDLTIHGVKQVLKLTPALLADYSKVHMLGAWYESQHAEGSVHLARGLFSS